jgi:hypothetical protein
MNDLERVVRHYSTTELLPTACICQLCEISRVLEEEGVRSFHRVREHFLARFLLKSDVSDNHTGILKRCTILIFFSTNSSESRLAKTDGVSIYIAYRCDSINLRSLPWPLGVLTYLYYRQAEHWRTW